MSNAVCVYSVVW